MKKVYDTGKQPSITAFGENKLLEVHVSEKTGWLWYHIGTCIFHSNDQENIEWNNSAQIGSALCGNGVKPQVIALDSSTFLEVHVQNKAMYRLGSISHEGNFEWKGLHDYTCSLSPSICKIDNKTVLEVHQSHCREALFYHVADVDREKWELHIGKDLSNYELTNQGSEPFVLHLEGRQVMVLYQFKNKVCLKLGELSGHSVNWDNPVECFSGNHPKAAYVGERKIVCLFNKNGYIYSAIGLISSNMTNVNWTSIKEMTKGSDSSITFLPKISKLVETHVEHGDLIHYSIGELSQDSISWNDNSIKKANIWMNRLSDHLLLSKINIPGTHDCGTAYLASKDGQYKKYTCQYLTFEEQLLAGVRYFDIRCSVLPQNDIPVIKHASEQCLTKDMSRALTLLDFFSAGKCFLKSNPSEVLIYEIKCEDFDSRGNSLRVIKQFLDHEIDCTDSIVWSKESYEQIPTLGEVRGKIMLLCRWENPRKAFDLSVWDNNTKGCESGNCFYIQDFYSTGFSGKKDCVKNALETIKEKPSNVMFLNYLSCTNPTNLLPLSEAKQMNAFFTDILMMNFRRLGTVILDFATPELCEKIISTN